MGVYVWSQLTKKPDIAGGCGFERGDFRLYFTVIFAIITYKAYEPITKNYIFGRLSRTNRRKPFINHLCGSELVLQSMNSLGNSIRF